MRAAEIVHNVMGVGGIYRATPASDPLGVRVRIRQRSTIASFPAAGGAGLNAESVVLVFDREVRPVRGAVVELADGEGTFRIEATEATDRNGYTRVAASRIE